MCGIAGVYSLTEDPPDPAWGDRLTRALRHRGPDGVGVYADSRVVLAHTRLAIIDLSDGGRQPMHSADGRRVLILNGEIYNHESIRRRLEREDGIRLRSRSDTEALLESLARRGARALDEIRGMFAFALYDQETGELTLARDRLGKKPLVYARTSEWVAFASEVATLLALPFVRARLDRASLGAYARWLYVPAPWTLLEGIRKLPPGTTLAIRRGQVEEPQRYWSLPTPGGGHDGDRTPRPSPQSTRELERELDELLLDATRLRTVSDVPVGVFLSGGIDSNAVLETLHRVGHRPIRAFTVGFPGLPDERPLAREGARRFADEHVEIDVRADVVEEVPRILRHFGEPLGDSAIVTTYLVAREASRHVKVILNGDGGDELFGGYARYPFARRLDLAASIPGGLSVARGFYRGQGHLDPIFDAVASRAYAPAARGLGAVLTPAQERSLLASAGRNGSEPWSLPAGPTPDADPRDVDGAADLTGALFDWDARRYLPDDLLQKVDLASMAHGLENRSPFLDHRFFELLGPLPASVRAHPFRTKPILRRLMRRRLPAAILRAPKRGFQLPLTSWLQGPLRRWVDGLLLDPQATGSLYRAGALASEVNRFHSGASDPHAPYRLWGLAALELWAREFHVEIPT